MREGEEAEVRHGRGVCWLPFLHSFHPHETFAQGPRLCFRGDAILVTSSVMASVGLELRNQESPDTLGLK